MSQKYDRAVLFFACHTYSDCFDRSQRKYSSLLEHQAGNNIHYFPSLHPTKISYYIITEKSSFSRNFPKGHGQFGFV